MTKHTPSQSSSLDDWLCYLEQVHPANIEMGLERVKRVATQIGLLDRSDKIILIAGTNGKGTTARCLESLLLAQGYRVGTYASPHLIKYNERVRINGEELDDQIHVDAFDTLETGRGDTALTYFEYGTLGALEIFKRFTVDYVLLEVGLGGRYDATNIVDPYACVITTVDLDHKEYLGDTRELVAFDKAGIFRTHTPAIIGDLNIPHTMIDYGKQLNADMVSSKKDFFFTAFDKQFRWQYRHFDWYIDNPGIPAQNAATALTLLAKLDLLPSQNTVVECLASLQVEGRFQLLSERPLIYTDVAHNRESARYLGKKLAYFKAQGFKIHALIAMLSDKDKVSVIKEVIDYVDDWSCASLNGPRGDTGQNLLALLPKPSQSRAKTYNSVNEGLMKIMPNTNNDTLVIVFGSFFTVAEAINCLKK